MAIFVSGPQEDGEEVVALCRVVAPLVNEAANASAQHLHSLVGATIARRLPTVGRQQERRGCLRSILHDDGHGRAQFVGFGEDVGVKERFADDAHGEIGHLPIDINDAPIRPGLLNLLAVVSHEVGIAGNMTRLERGGHELALVTVEIALATEDAITNHRAKAVMDCQAFVEVIGMFDQNAVDMLWCVEQDAGERSKVHAADVASACQAL